MPILMVLNFWGRKNSSPCGVSLSGSLFPGPTGFDSGQVCVVSMSGDVEYIRENTLQLLLGENNFALAA